MNKSNARLPKMSEITLILFVFLIIMFFSIAVFDIPLQLSLFISLFVFIGFGMYLGNEYNVLQKSIAKGIYDGIEAVLVLVAVGALIGTWVAGGIVPTMVYYGLELIHPNVFLLAALLASSITSIVTGTAWGSAGTIGIAMMAVGESFGIPLPIVAGVVISGAIFGDKISPLSDTTVLAASLAKVNIMDHVRSMLHVSIPAYIITSILLLITGFFYGGSTVDLSIVQNNIEALLQNFNVSWYMTIPVLIVVILLVLKQPPVPTISLGAFLGIIWAWWFQGMDFVTALKTSYTGVTMDATGIEFIDKILGNGGILSVLEVIFFIIIALGFGGLLQSTGILTVISSMLSRWVKNSKGRLTVSTILTAFFGNLFAAAGYVSIITGTKMTEGNYDRLKIQRRVLSRNTEVGGTMTVPMVPWSEGAIFYTALLGVPTLSYLPFLWLSFVMIIISIFYGYINTFMWTTDEKDKFDKPQKISS